MQSDTKSHSDRTRMPTCVQTAEGKKARAPVSSELAAMFAYAVLPTIRKHYRTGGDEAYQQLCRNFAREAQIPQQYWGAITVPCFFSLDWDTRHTWLRSVIQQPRGADVAGFDQRAVSQRLGAPGPHRHASNLQLFDEASSSSRVRELMRHGSAQHNRSRDLHRAINQDGCHPVLLRRWHESLSNINYITVHERQLMPLSKISPDIHSPPEHMVGTLKGDVRLKILGFDLSNELLWQGAQYQRWINDAVVARGNGPEGRKHILGSVRKQVIICRVLAADRGQDVHVDVVTGPADKPVVSETVTLKGTAGAWIRDTRWT